MSRTAPGEKLLPKAKKLWKRGKSGGTEVIFPSQQVSNDMLRNILPITFKHVEPRTIIPVIAGRITFSLGKWKELTCDPAILSAVTGYRIEIVLTPLQVTRPGPISFLSQDALNIDRQNSQFSGKGGHNRKLP